MCRVKELTTLLVVMTSLVYVMSQEDSQSEAEKREAHLVGEQQNSDIDDKRHAPMFVGKRHAPMFVGKRHVPMFVGKRHVPMFVGKRQAPMFVGRRQAPMFVGRRQAPMFVGKRKAPMFVGKRRAPMFVGKRKVPMFVGKRRAPMFVGKRQAPMFVGKRQAPMFVGKRHVPMFVGKRQAPMFVGKRQAPMFVGKRQAPMFVGKRQAPMFVGKRQAPMFVGKRYSDYSLFDTVPFSELPLTSDESGDNVAFDSLDGADPSSMVDLGEGSDDPDKRGNAPLFVGKRVAAPMFVGKREMGEAELNSLLADPTFNDFEGQQSKRQVTEAEAQQLRETLRQIAIEAMRQRIRNEKRKNGEGMIGKRSYQGGEDFSDIEDETLQTLLQDAREHIQDDGMADKRSYGGLENTELRRLADEVRKIVIEDMREQIQNDKRLNGHGWVGKREAEMVEESNSR